MSLKPGLQIPYGIQPVKALPVDSYSGPYEGVDAATAIAAANAAIPSNMRFKSMDVRLIIAGVSHKYWYRDGIANVNLVEFIEGLSIEDGSSYGDYIYWDGSAWIPGSDRVKVGAESGQTSQGESSVAIGYQAGKNTQGTESVAIGNLTGRTSQGISSIAIGSSSGSTNQGTQSVAIGSASGVVNQGSYSISIGQGSAGSGQGDYSIAIGSESATASQATESVAIGRESGKTGQLTKSIAIGSRAGYSSQGTTSVSIGANAGETSQGTSAISIGNSSGNSSQGNYSVAIGRSAAGTSQGTSSVAIGDQAGSSSQGSNSIAIGSLAGDNQGNSSIAIGKYAGSGPQGDNAIAIGSSAGNSSQGNNSIAIGNLAGETSQHANSIILNASGSSLNSDGASRTYVSPIRNITSTGANTKALVYDTSTKEVSNISISSINSTFESDIAVALFDGKSFGKYLDGQVVPSTGKTPDQVMKMAMVENPVTTLTTPTTIQFNQTVISNTLNFTYSINSLIGATISSAVLQWRRGGTGSWTTLSTSTTTPATFIHALTDSNFNTSAFNYRYTVTDTKNETVTKTVDITPAAYVAPTILLNVTAASLTDPETDVKREKGNISTTLSGTITRNSPSVNLTSFVVQYQVNGTGSWTDIGTATSISGSSYNFSGIVHNDVSLKTANSISYRVKVIDAYQTYISSQVYSATTTVDFRNIIFYAPVASAPATSADVRAITARIFTDGDNPFILNTGTTEKIFTAAMPATLSISNVTDLDALGANITTNYALSTFNVNDAGGTATSYKVYTLTNLVKYDNNHRHQITRS